MGEKIAGIGDDAVENATGERWSHWLGYLDGVDGTSLTHQERVAELAAAGVESGWWQQQLAVGYERERGLRAVGETADAGFEIGVQRTLPVSREALWSFLTSRDGLERWLGDVDSISLEPGSRYETADGTTGEVRTLKRAERIRMTWQPSTREGATTLQLTLTQGQSGDEKTALRIHQEHLADAAERETMRAHWQDVLDAVESFVGAQA